MSDKQSSDVGPALLASAITIVIAIVIFAVVFSSAHLAPIEAPPAQSGAQPTASASPAGTPNGTAGSNSAAAANTSAVAATASMQPEAASQTAATTTAALDPDQVHRGQTLYSRSCVMCHGPAGKGVPNLGNDLTASAFVKTAGLTEVQDVIRHGRMVNDPANKSKLPMPAKGGNPALNDTQIAAIAVYCKSLVQ